MPTGVTLADLSQKLRAAIGQSLNVAHGVDQEASLREGLRRTQSDLWVMHDWPTLTIRRTVSAPIGSRYINIPSEIDFGHINEVYAKDAVAGAKWRLIEFGISIDDFNLYDSTADERGDQILRWGPNLDTQIEVWPIPKMNQTVMFLGRKNLSPLLADTDTCTLDSDLIVATLAAQMLARQNSNDAQIQLNKAQAILNRLRARQGSNKRQPFLMGTYL